MNFTKALLFFGLIGSATANLRSVADNFVPEAEHLDLEVMVGNERQLFPLLPGTKCPTGHTCRARTAVRGVSPFIPAMKSGMKTNLQAKLDWNELNDNLQTVVKSNDFCTRRQAMARAAGMAAGVSMATIAMPAYAAQTAEVKMGTDAGGLQFVPAKTTICSGDSVKWINNKGGPHNVVFDEEAIPEGVDQEKISMEEQLGEEGDTFTMSFTTKGEYSYYCEPHRGAGMNAVLVVS
mmetsp:Transcript_21947/g.50024  ORF Transcript_21947/g.50024 Transcript_21947/m.50024 type:complete len:236 (-) Transcript_21947:133-840(-)|eukprot:CAMPEP_0113306274 /NCGR_PEP_ID=MMETSP0010_2-20120614/5589_1 /TAXON_ID=216773 ORGANISM="Corethron hystrix, Strain 308" /NCGR_SAMPLE_ID=MMETSP0010_2 /ASSEMBLY_ACC=CAM_ASM_000155 /LENGTH=235 /DNA_ID=CAMNT_0000160905 /DNA_START=90 /DNA_END=797 /DNA_ORIENTATION=- /assembly_acc=CAM_ASM_000155